ERLLSCVGLRDEQVIDVHTELFGVGGIERMLRIDERRGPAATLYFRDHLQGERGFTGRFRSINLDYSPARQATDTERDVETERAGGNGFHVVRGGRIAEAHHRAFAELLFDLT